MVGPGGLRRVGKSAAVHGGDLRRASAVLLMLAAALALFLFGGGGVGQAQTPPALVSNVGQDLDFYRNLGNVAERAQGFTTGANLGGYTLTGIDLNLRSENAGTVPPTVTLHRGSATGTKVADLNGPSALIAGSTDTYRFTPTETVRLSSSTNYWVVAEGGSDDNDWTQTESNAEDATPASGWSIQDGSGFRFVGSSGVAFTRSSRSLRLSIHGTARVPAANTSATGAPAITAPNVFRVPAVLGVDLTGITDANGTEDIAYTATYKWQRFDSTGATLETDSIGTGSTYTLTDADVGKALKVVVSFTDDDGYSEGPLTSDATSTITAAPVTLVSNTEQGGDSNADYTGDHGQAFTTGYNLTGYTVTGVAIISEDTGSDDIALQICGVDSGGSPTTTCTDLTAPDSFAAGSLVFNVPTGSTLTLSSGTTYMVVFKSPGGEQVHVDATTSDGEDPYPLPGWSIRNLFQWNNAGSWQDSSRGRALRIAINGTFNPPSSTAPTAMDSTVSATEDTAYTFTAADFNFSATSASDALASAQILTLPDKGTLALSGAAVTANQSVTRAQLDAGNLVYTPPADGSGSGYTSFFFRVSGSSEASSRSYSMSIDVTGTQDVTTGAPTISGTAKVELVLTAITTTIQDADGMGSFSYQWIRVDADGTSNAANIGGNSNTYLLVDEDLGKRIKVRVDFTDGLDAAGSLTSDAYPADGTVQRIDATLVSNLTQTGDSSALYTRDHGQAFTTGSNASGYTVTGVTIISEDPNDDEIALQICEVDSGGSPTMTCTNLTAPASFARGPLDFTVPNGTPLPLEADTTYMVVFTAPTSPRVLLVDATTSAGQDTASLTGWSIKDKFQWYNLSDTWADAGRNAAIRIAIKGPSRVTFDPDTVTREFDENTGADHNVGGPVTATYTGTCALTHTLVGADAASFEIDSSTGQIKTRAGVTYDHEAKSSYTVTVAASDVNCGADTATVTINVNDVDEPPRVPLEVLAYAVPRTYDQLFVRWTPPENAGRPDITGYDIQYDYGNNDNWINGPQNVDGTSAEITGLEDGAFYGVRVRAKNDEGSGPWAVTDFTITNVLDVEVETLEPFIPDGLVPGDRFRLLFVTPPVQALNTDMVYYVDWVGARVLGLPAGHPLHRLFKLFYAVVSTRYIDARVITNTTYTNDDKGVPIYWVGGARAADDYEDLYDGDWDDESARNEWGEVVPLPDGVWTGSTADGRELLDGGTSSALGQSQVGYGAPGSTTPGEGPLHSGSTAANTEMRPIFSLSTVLRVVQPPLVTNVGQMFVADDGDERSARRSQAFTTGSNGQGYEISSVAVGKYYKEIGNVDVSIYSVDANGHPDTRLFALTNPDAYTDDTQTFDTPAGATLDPGTTYAVVVQPTTSGTDVELLTTGSDSEDVESLDGWSIADAFDIESEGSWQPDLDGESLILIVRGIEKALDCEDSDIWCATATLRAKVEWEGRYDLHTGVVVNTEFSHHGEDYQLLSIEMVQNGRNAGDDNHVVLPFGIPERTHFLIDFYNLNGIGHDFFEPPNDDWLDWTLHVTTVKDGETLTAALRFSEARKLAGAWWRWSGRDIDYLRRAWTEAQTYKLRLVEDPRSERTPQPLNPPLYLRAQGEVNTTQTWLRWLTPQTRYDMLPLVDSYKIQWKPLSGSWETPTDVTEFTRGPTINRSMSHFLDGLTPGVEYNIRVIATDSVGDSEPSNEITYAKPAAAQQSLSNIPAEEEPRVDGIPEVGQTLSADTTTIADADGLENAVFQYQWLADDADIAGATGASYTVVSEDAGKAIRVRVTFTDDEGNEETLTSAPTVVTAAGLQLQAATVDGSILTLTYSEVLDTGVTLGTSAFAVSVNGSSRSLIGVAVGESNVLLLLSTAVEAGDTVTVGYTVPDGPDFIRDIRGRKAASFSGQAVTNGAASTALKARAHNVPSSHNGEDAFTFELRFSEEPRSDLSDTTLRDHAFTVAGGSVNNVRRLEPGQNVRWEITVLPDSSADVVMALNATTDCSADGAICTEDGGKLSGGLQVVVPWPNTPPTGLPTIAGTAQVGETLTADITGIFDADGLDNATFAYQWLADNAEINGATASGYTLVAADEGKAVRVRVSFTDDADNDEELTSAATGVVETSPPPNTPATGAPTIAGTARVGESLTADITSIFDADGLDNATFAYQWLADNAEVNGATASSYILVAAEEDKAVRVRVSFTDDADNGEELTSAATAAVVSLPLMASAHDVPSSHNGEDAFTFELSFSEEPKPDFSYKTLRDHAFTVTGGQVTEAQRLERPSNIRWGITVRPDSSGAVTVVLPVTGDCEANGAICTEDGRRLSNRLEVTVNGPEPASLPAAPTNLTGFVNSGGHVVLTWTAPDDGQVTGYRILRRRPTLGEDVLLEYVTNTQSTAATFTDTDVTPGVQHVYRVQALSAAGRSQRSNYVNVTP